MIYRVKHANLDYKAFYPWKTQILVFYPTELHMVVVGSVQCSYLGCHSVYDGRSLITGKC